MVIRQLHKCDARHIQSVPVEEVYQGKVIWAGIVEVFDAIGHPKTKHCYAWSHRDGDDDRDERFVAVLGLPPVSSPETAVKIAIASEVKSKKTRQKPDGVR